MKIRHFPENVQSALRVEAITTAKRVERLLNARRVSSPAALLALSALFASLAMNSAAAKIAGGVRIAFSDALDTAQSPDMTPTAAERAVIQALFVTDDVLPANTTQVIEDNREACVRSATPIQDEAR